jgi:hypothetical protein
MILFFYLLFFLDTSSSLSTLLLPNPYGSFALEGRKATFSGGGCGHERSLVMREGVSDGIMEVFVLFVVYLFVVIFTIINTIIISVCVWW